MPNVTHAPSTIGARLHARLRRAPSGCLEWTGAKANYGYGRIGDGSSYVRTHRLAWELEYGPIPPGINVLHHCDNPPCCEPTHLFLGTQADNARDMMAKGRGRGQIPKGVEHPSARLSDIEVATLRRMAAGVGNYAELGRMFGVSKQYARALVLGKKRPPRPPDTKTPRLVA